MKILIRNFLSIIRRFKTSVFLNVIGLSIAFAAFMIILMQLRYDWTFDRSVKHADSIYRLDVFDSERGQMAITPRPLSEYFIQSSPYIQAGVICDTHYGDLQFSIEKEGNLVNYQEQTRRVSPGFIEVFGLEMIEGDTHALEVNDHILIPESMARKLFGNQPAINKVIKLTKSTFTVGGVYRDLAENSSMKNCIYYSLGDENKDSWQNWNYSFYFRLDHPEHAKGLIENFITYINGELPNNNDLLRNMRIENLRLESLTGLHFSDQILYDSTPKTSKETVWVLMGIAIILIVIAGINYTNFSTSLTPMRIKSINTQMILGSPTEKIRLMLITEAIFISLLSFGLALFWVHIAGKSFLTELISVDMGLPNHWSLIGGTALIVLITGLLAGIYPAYYMTSFQPALVLKGSFGLSPAGRKIRSLLISIQYIASFALIIGALFMFLQNRYMRSSALGYEREQLIVCGIAGSKAQKSYESLREQIRQAADVQDVTFAASILSSQDQYMNWGRTYKDKNISYQVIPVESNFLRVMGIQVTEGRDFRDADHETTEGAYIFNESARKKYTMELNDLIGNSPIVGFMPDIKFASLRMEVTPMCFHVIGKTLFGEPAEKWEWNNFLYVQIKAGSDLFAAMKHIEKTLQSFDPSHTYHPHFFDKIMDQVYRKENNMSKLITVSSLIAIFISIVGVFGLVLFDSEYRKKEIGIRRVFGSTSGEILLLFNKVYLRILLICFGLAAPLAWYTVNRWLENFAYKTPMYLWVYLVAFVIIALITFATVTFQNWRAANANPVDSLKYE